MIGHNGPPDDKFNDASPGGGWFAITRRVLDHPIVGMCQPVKPADPARGSASRCEAWIDLLRLAQYKPARVNNRGEVITLDVGQLMGARSFLMARWNWTDKSVRHYLEILEREGMIEVSAGQQRGQQNEPQRKNSANVITICNFTRYQRITEAIESYIADVRGQQRGQRGASKRASEGPAINLARGQRGASKTQCNSTASGDANSARGQQPPELPTQEGPAKGPESYKDKQLTNNPPTPQGGLGLAADTASQAPSGVEAQFAEWWATYPASARKVGKGECFVLFRQLVTGQRREGTRRKADGVRATAEELIAGAKSYAVTKPDPDYVPSPITWLNQGRWLDLVGEPNRAAASALWWADASKVATMTAERWRAGIALHANGRWPVDKLGPPPGSPQCVVPRDLIRELRLEECYTPHGLSRLPH